MKRKIALLLALGMLLSMSLLLTSCSKESDENTFTYLLAQNEDASFYSDYSKNPSLLYLLNREYAGAKLSFDFKALVSGSENDQFNTMISTGSYYDIMNMSFSGYSAEALNEMGIALDLTELVDQYMPNYKKFLDDHPDVARVAYTMKDGERKVYQLYSARYEPNDNFQGFIYRRDWLAKYGKDVNGQPFTYSYDENGVLTDNIIFPSFYSDSPIVTAYKERHPDWDGTDPVFISDWEWMFGVFDEAKAALGIDSYNISFYYYGFMETGDLYSSFGGGAPLWSYDQETNSVSFNAASVNMQAYLECLNNWYEKGWLDNAFNEHSADMFYSIDTAKIRSGEIAMWKGQMADLGNQIEDTANYPLTEGIYGCGAKMPVNDVYGPDECKGVDPDALYQYERAMTSIIITDKAADKNLPALLTFFDALCECDSELSIAKVIGLNKEQYESIEDLEERIDGMTFQERFGLTEGNYTVSKDEEGNDVYTLADPLLADSLLKNAAISNQIFGMGMKATRITYSPEYFTSVRERWDYYPNQANIPTSVVKMLGDEDSKTYSSVRSVVNTRMSTDIPAFIKGQKDIYGSDWDDYRKAIGRLGAEQVTEIFNNLYQSFE